MEIRSLAQLAYDLRNISSTIMGYLSGITSDVQTQLNVIGTKAPLASPTFTGTPNLPTGTIAVTQAAGDNSTNVATTAFTKAEITAMVSGANVSLSANGYQKLPSGLILQWGTYTAATGNATITFPIAFPTFCINIFDIMGTTTGINATAEVVVSKTTSSAVVFTYGTGTYPHLWFALGY